MRARSFATAGWVLLVALVASRPGGAQSAGAAVSSRWLARAGSRTVRMLGDSVREATTRAWEKSEVFWEALDSAHILRGHADGTAKELRVVDVNDSLGQSGRTISTIRSSRGNKACRIDKAGQKCNFRQLNCKPTLLSPQASCTKSAAADLKYDENLTGDPPCHSVSPGIQNFTFLLSCALLFQADENVTDLEVVSAGLKNPDEFWIYNKTDRGLLAIYSELTSLRFTMKAFNFARPFSDNTLIEHPQNNITREQLLGKEPVRLSMKFSPEILALDSPFAPGGRVYLEARLVGRASTIPIGWPEMTDVARIFLDVTNYAPPSERSAIAAWIPVVISLCIVFLIGTALFFWTVAYRRRQKRLFSVESSFDSHAKHVESKNKQL